MNNVYFGEKGISSTEGNFLCNLAKEKIQSLTDRLNNVKLYQTEISVIGSKEKQLLTVGQTDINWIDKALLEIAEMNSFCAWVREAIKEKEAQLDNIQDYKLANWIKENNIELPIQAGFLSCEPDVTEKDIIDSFDINKRNKYLRLEAFAATFGKYIHPNGVFNKARKEAFNAESNPIYKEGSGADTVLYYQSPTIKVEEIDNVFLALQNAYREYEKELNMMKAEIKDTISKKNIEKEQRYTEALDKQSSANKTYEEAFNKVKSNFNKWQTSERNRIAQLKIVIPDNLQSIYRKIKE